MNNESSRRGVKVKGEEEGLRKEKLVKKITEK